LQPADDQLPRGEVMLDIALADSASAGANSQRSRAGLLRRRGKQLGDDLAWRVAGWPVEQLGPSAVAADLVPSARRFGARSATHRRDGGVRGEALRLAGMSPIWIWTQGAIVVCVLAAMVIAIVKLS
jgi:hypothetical protein